MRVAHAVVVAPRRSGLYETTRDLVAAERSVGIDARLIDVNETPTSLSLDRGVPIAEMSWAHDVLASHSGHEGTPLDTGSAPIVAFAHGRPESSWRIELEGGAPIVSYYATRSQRSRYRACVTFWPEHIAFLRALWAPTPVLAIEPPVDLGAWAPGPTSYNFAGHAGRINVVMTDSWARRDTPIAGPLSECAQLARRMKGTRVHVYGVHAATSDAWRSATAMVQHVLGSSLGVCQGWASDLRSVYRAADLVVTGHRIATRTVREAMACGCDVAYAGTRWAETWAPVDRAVVRDRARERFDPSLAARRLVALYTEVCDAKAA